MLQFQYAITKIPQNQKGQFKLLLSVNNPIKQKTSLIWNDSLTKTLRRTAYICITVFLMKFSCNTLNHTMVVPYYYLRMWKNRILPSRQIPICIITWFKGFISWYILLINSPLTLINTNFSVSEFSLMYSLVLYLFIRFYEPF